MVPARVNQRYTIRFALAAPNASSGDVGKLLRTNIHYYIYMMYVSHSAFINEILGYMDNKCIILCIHENFITYFPYFSLM